MGRHKNHWPPKPIRRASRVILLAGFACLLPLTGCSTFATSPSMTTVPPEWRTRNSWGPEGNAARADGTLQPLFYNEKMAALAAFGREHIQEGDFLFRYGISYDPRGLLLSGVIAHVGDSPFSHEAVAHWEGEVLYVYDAVPAPEGVRKIPFEFWALDNAPHSFAIKRLKPEYQPYIPAAMGYLEMVYLMQPPFDPALRLDDDRVYCSEMIEKAFRASGLVLSEPVPIRCLPNYLHYRFLRPLAALAADVDVNEPVFAPGNECYGLFGSPQLDLVYSELREHREEYRKAPYCTSEESDTP
jgi:Permuted papain-like amidase enzyme, YaeF/YiiX, C92 family